MMLFLTSGHRTTASIRSLTAALLVGAVMGMFALVAFPPVALAQPVEWEQVGAEVVNVKGLAFDEADTLWAINSFALQQFPPNAEAWVEISEVEGNRLLFTAAGTLLVESGGLLRSTDRGRTFESVGQRSSGGLYEVPADVGGPFAGRIFVGLRIGPFDGAAFSTDDGVTWTEVPIGDPDTFGGDAQAFLAIPDGPHAGRVVAACYNGLAYSDDGGLSWQLSSVWEPFAFAAFSVVRLPLDSGPHGGRLLATVDGPAFEDVYASDDGGKTWAPFAVLGPEAQGVRLLYVGATAAGPQTVYAVGVFSDVWRSGDGGQTWEALGNVYPAKNTGVEDAVVSSGGRLYVTQDQGGPSTLTDGVYRTVVPVAAAGEETPLPSANTASLTVYPNPTSGTASIALALDMAVDARVVVYDVLGREVAVLHNGPLIVGDHEWSLDGRGLPSGLYLVRALTGREVVTARLTLLR